MAELPSSWHHRGRLEQTNVPFLTFEYVEGDHAYLWLPIQHVSIAIPGHNMLSGMSVQQASEAATYLLPVTIVARINYRDVHKSGDYAAYIGVGLPTHSRDLQRVMYIAAHGNKIESALAEHLFRALIDKRYGEGVILHRA